MFVRRNLLSGMFGLAILACTTACAAEPQAPLTVVGDSLAVGLAAALKDVRPDLSLASLGVVSSGLINRHFFDWQARIRAVAASRPAYVVVMLGMNDSGMEPTPAYSLALVQFLTPLEDAKIPFTVISVPLTDDPVRNRNIDDLNTLYAFIVPQHGGQFIRLPPFDRAKRSHDGIHFTRAGYRALAESVLPELHV